jgi:hypothetical protein
MINRYDEFNFANIIQLLKVDEESETSLKNLKTVSCKDFPPQLKRITSKDISVDRNLCRVAAVRIYMTVILT